MRRSLFTKIASCLSAAALVFGMCPAAALAGDARALAPAGPAPSAEAPSAQPADPIASGTWGTCPWEISADGVLTIHPGTGQDTKGICPWEANAADVKRVVCAEEGGSRVVAPVRSRRDAMTADSSARASAPTCACST